MARVKSKISKKNDSNWQELFFVSTKQKGEILSRHRIMMTLLTKVVLHHRNCCYALLITVAKSLLLDTYKYLVRMCYRHTTDECVYLCLFDRTAIAHVPLCNISGDWKEPNYFCYKLIDVLFLWTGDASQTLRSNF